ncbi:hypothetical protein R3W88_020113 [Solanum pinnatisectum]|uniref:Endonuclease/exonuclease/phosphatase domain-containing protein n=1 Tax=Solanum pinnatisectum TaxID=50273 RepID=A0AAV9KL64_9SOLN|nr:hypothetical protein R3W88_020113 [Solanum pinnatisectum]
MEYANYNRNGKIWVFVQKNIQCSALERLSLWDDIYLLSHNMRLPWLVGSDFNVILNDEEKIGGLPVYPREYEDFALCVNSCELFYINFKGSPFTWWNGRADAEFIFKRLDRLMTNHVFLGHYGNMELEHLARTGFDHAPMLLSCRDQTTNINRSFRFLKFWKEKTDFKDVVRDNWVGDESIDVFISLKQKMKRTKIALSTWSKVRFCDIFKQLVIGEDIVRIKEGLFEELPTAENRAILQKAQAELKQYLHYEEEFWRQKSSVKWFTKGDKNTRFFHNLVKGRRKRLLKETRIQDFFHNLVNRRRKRLQVKRIIKRDGAWTDDVEEVATEAVASSKISLLILRMRHNFL